MPFPEILPERLAKAGKLLAQLSFGSHMGTCVEYSIFLFLTDDSSFALFHGMMNLKAGVFGGHNQKFSTLGGVLARIKDVIDNQEKRSGTSIANGELFIDTLEGAAFADGFLRENPDLSSSVVRIGHRDALSVKPPEPAPPRTILSRSEWMARHYPDRVKS